MKIVSIGLYNPVPISSGSDSYVTYLLNSIRGENEIIHYYYSNQIKEKGHFPSKIYFTRRYLKSIFSQKVEKSKLPKVIKLLRPDLLINKTSIDSIHADVVLCDDFTYPVSKYISKKNRCPLILIKHDILWKKLKSDGIPFYFLIAIYEKYISKRVNAITTISEDDFNEIKKFYKGEHIFYVPAGIDINIFNPDVPAYNFGKDKYNLLFYGSLDRPMNIVALEFIVYQLIPELKKQNLLEKIRINIFGSGVPPPSLKLHTINAINFLGQVDNPAEFINGSDLVIVPLKNSCGVKIRILESLLCGKQLLVTPEASLGLPKELKKYVYIENDASGFVKKISNLLSEKEKYKIDIINVNKILHSYLIGDVIKKIVTRKNNNFNTL
jgi:hypothetical protein